MESIKLIEKKLETNTAKITKQTQIAITKATNLSIKNSIIALDTQNQKMMEMQTVEIAGQIANFLKARDRDILFLAKSKISQKQLQKFFDTRYKEILQAHKYIYNSKKDTWEKVQGEVVTQTTLQILNDNKKDFHKAKIKQNKKISVPIYSEITYYNITGQEIYKISKLNTKKVNISKKENTYLKAEDYFQKAKGLKSGEIYVSNVIGEYIPSKVIGPYTKRATKKLGLRFKPKQSAYAGAENPVGKRFRAIIRFVTPIFKNGHKTGYITLALDHRHIMNFTDFKNPLSVQPLDIPDASKGNYAFLWDSQFRCISHPREYFIMGYNKDTGELVPGWIDSELEKEFQLSGFKSLNLFLKNTPIFSKQSFSKKPNTKQMKAGEIGLDCKYLNFAPQCHGWSELTKDGGYGSFVIFWSGIWKLTTAASIPYYTGQYGNSPRGFGFVTIGANVGDFHKSAIQTKVKVQNLVKTETKNIKKDILLAFKSIQKEVNNQINKMGLITLILILLLIYIAILLANYLTKRLTHILTGIDKIKNQEFGYKIEVQSEDELGMLADAFNDMSESIRKLNKNLYKRIYTDELTGLKNRTAFAKDTSDNSNEYLVYLCDIDFFKHINDYYGTEAGNFVLKSFAKVLKSFANHLDIEVYRLGSDEFVLLEKAKFNKEKITQRVGSLNKLISKTKYKKDSLNINISISITCGISYGHENLLEKADLALNEAYSSKKEYLIFDYSNSKIIQHKDYIYWRKKIQFAIKHDSFIPYFQPIIDTRNPNIKKYECLIRMMDNNNIISPNMFLKVAKEAKLYPKLTKIIIEKTFKVFDKKDATFSINISELDIMDEATVSFMVDMLKKYNVKDKLILEILETEEIGDFNTLLKFTHNMRKYGVRFAIDDFGSGYSNFAYLRKIKPDFIKIDGSLIKNMHKDKDTYEIVKAIIKFSNILGSTVIAEFVQNEATVKLLNELGVNLMQGYYFSEPKESII
ncbi:EAL domain-containing protein [Sulfurimonas sp.]